ncbi:hypothetical protein EVAR_87834_1 [Eumeta japonica]|uniref:Uncharacterized protein n=1 Tax=Eumeta variegata TaxID=151549 RepID=A0A4C1YFZ1_EUMVA|nr:hypothetical protein EVAR_87834_1 [Eumeta japonica]
MKHFFSFAIKPMPRPGAVARFLYSCRIEQEKRNKSLCTLLQMCRGEWRGGCEVAVLAGGRGPCAARGRSSPPGPPPGRQTAGLRMGGKQQPSCIVPCESPRMLLYFVQS